MSRRSAVQITILTLVLLAGFGVGLGASFSVWPVSCAGASPQHLCQRERCTWAGWAADAYRENGDLALAVEQMNALGSEAADTLCRLARGECPTCRPGQAEAGLALAAALGLACPASQSP